MKPLTANDIEAAGLKTWKNWGRPKRVGMGKAMRIEQALWVEKHLPYVLEVSDLSSVSQPDKTKGYWAFSSDGILFELESDRTWYALSFEGKS